MSEPEAPTRDEAKCQRCGDCPTNSHHWMPNSDFGDGDDPLDSKSVEFAYICKHCPAMGGECPDCNEGLVVGIVLFAAPDGTEYSDESEYLCSRCGGEGVVAGLRFDVFERGATHV